MCVKYYYMSLQRWLSKPVVSSGFMMDQRTTKKAKYVAFGLRLIRQVNTAPSNYKKKLIQPTLSSTDKILNIAGK